MNNRINRLRRRPPAMNHDKTASPRISRHLIALSAAWLCLVPAATALPAGLVITAGPDARGAPPRDGALVSISIAEKTPRHTAYLVSYNSGGLIVKGRLFVPEGIPRGERRPAVVFNHGGVSGIPQPLIVRCAELAGAGYVVVAPSYRGEDGSEGEIEVAAGEVDDALNAMKLAARLPYVDPDRIAMAGTSHGALVTLLAAARSPEILRAAVAAYGVTNAVSWYRYNLESGKDVSDPLSLKVYGAGPDDKPEAFRVRSPVLFAADFSAPLLLLYGEKDDVVPPAQGTELAEKLKKHGKNYEFHVIPNVGHGFLFYLNPELHSPAEMREADRAWSLVLDFLRKHLEPNNAEK
ncbi:MAG: prolyl oligopeptidase family serine peptidase [bacterium]